VGLERGAVVVQGCGYEDYAAGGGGGFGGWVLRGGGYGDEAYR